MRRFLIKRTEDVSGVSGTGHVAEGVQFHDGQCAVSWFGRFHITEIAPDIDTWLNVHGHGGKTTVQWLDGPFPVEATTTVITIEAKDGLRPLPQP